MKYAVHGHLGCSLTRARSRACMEFVSMYEVGDRRAHFFLSCGLMIWECQ
uniref:Uncharacterized protein n=1 Tax=Physcomitrium patens TaxID=3218 RepID=A0A7I4D9Z7_PHYPA